MHSYANDGAEQEYALHFCVSVKEGNAPPKTGLIQCRDLPGDLAMTICIYYYSNEASE